MASKPEESFARMQQKNLEMATRLAQMSIENAQRILQLQVEVAKEIFEDGVESARKLAEAKTPQEAMELRAGYSRQTAERMFSCSQNISAITAEVQGELGKLMSEQLNKGSQEMFDAMQQMLSGMPLNSKAAAEALQHTFDTARKTLEQVSKASADAMASAALSSRRKH